MTKTVILDTNVISETFRRTPEEVVGNWLRLQPKSQLFTTAINKAELLTGLAMMSDGKRKQALANVMAVFFDDRLTTPVLAFDERAALHYARIFDQRRKLGRPISEMDCQIAAIALAHGHAVATRNVWDFQNSGVKVINPWEALP